MILVTVIDYRYCVTCRSIIGFIGKTIGGSFRTVVYLLQISVTVEG
jgi:hypothetical protein